MKKSYKMLLAACLAVTSTYAQTNVPNAGSVTRPVPGGSWLRFETGGDATSIVESWGLNLVGSNTQHVKVRNTSFLVGYDFANQDLGVGNALISGNLGLDTISPGNKLHIQGGSVLVKHIRSAANSEWPLIYGTQHVDGVAGMAGLYLFEDGSGAFGQGSGLSFKTSTNDVSPVTNLTIRGNGNVGIGTTTPDAKLAVNGTIHTREVRVDTQNFPDFVFKPTYTLPSLIEVENYIDQKGHLPGMPSEAEAIKEGISLGEMNKKLLQKVEELTLYLIEKDKQYQQLSGKLYEQGKAIHKLQKKLKQR